MPFSGHFHRPVLIPPFTLPFVTWLLLFLIFGVSDCNFSPHFINASLVYYNQGTFLVGIWWEKDPKLFQKKEIFAYLSHVLPLTLLANA